MSHLKRGEQSAIWLGQTIFGCLVATAIGQQASEVPLQVPTAGEASGIPEIQGSSPPAVQPTGQLPWSAHDVQGAPPSSPREMLELFDIGESQLRSLFDGEPLGEADEEILVKLLFRFPRMGEENIDRWCQPIPLNQSY